VGYAAQVDDGPVLVSACLAGRACAYDGSARSRECVLELVRAGRAVLVCPEDEGGLGTPRPPAEIVGGTGEDVLDGRARVRTHDGADVTDAYIEGARIAVERAMTRGCTTAILKTRSPSCGCGRIYDGTFSRRLAAGDGVTAAALKRAGVRVVTDEEL
jgi:uncharacterized protein YbbK (DUF523 family)